jgi:prepilin-type N-terminal cleavage/methylation domain-containing protein
MRADEGMPLRSQRGFTLVEIAIVLVIIGLLLGGILKGQEMITQAKIKNIINDFNGLSAAMYSYQDRYRAMPGDDLNASGRWAGSQSGDGNGQFNKASSAGTTPELYSNVPTVIAGAPEVNLFWWHLRLSGFVAGSTASTNVASIMPPANAVNGLVGVQTTGMGFTSNIICTSNLQDKIAVSIDTQLDDGTSTTGQLRGLIQSTPNQATGTTAPTSAYAETGTNSYVLCKNL